MWRTNGLYYISMIDEAVNLVFTLSENPEAFAEQLMNELHDRIWKGKKREKEQIKSRESFNQPFKLFFFSKINFFTFHIH